MSHGRRGERRSVAERARSPPCTGAWRVNPGRHGAHRIPRANLGETGRTAFRARTGEARAELGPVGGRDRRDPAEHLTGQELAQHRRGGFVVDGAAHEREERDEAAGCVPQRQQRADEPPAEAVVPAGSAARGS
jgi:hypothetical protein